jgi:hypothetical protein
MKKTKKIIKIVEKILELIFMYLLKFLAFIGEFIYKYIDFIFLLSAAFTTYCIRNAIKWKGIAILKEWNILLWFIVFIGITAILGCISLKKYSEEIK